MTQCSFCEICVSRGSFLLSSLCNYFSNIQFFIQQICVESRVCAGYCSRCGDTDAAPPLKELPCQCGEESTGLHHRQRERAVQQLCTVEILMQPCKSFGGNVVFISQRGFSKEKHQRLHIRRLRPDSSPGPYKPRSSPFPTGFFLMSAFPSLGQPATR